MVSRGALSGIIYHFFKSGHKVTIFILALTFPLLLSSCGGLMKVDPIVEAEKSVSSADPFMGDWQGEWQLDDGADSGPLVAQVIALGKGKYRAVFFDEFDTRSEALAVLNDEVEDEKASFAGQADSAGGELDIKANIGGDKFVGSFKGWDFSGKFELSRAIRVSPAMGAKPPAGAIVLFNGKNFRQWKHTPSKKKPVAGKVQWSLKKGAMEVKARTGSIVTKKKFTDFKLHIEFRTPFMPDKRGQARGNSGVYLQGRYEVQVLDSYGLEGKDNECGGIYKVGPPLVNMCAPPMQWQTYDITFHAPKAGNPARTTVVHNGVTIHDEMELKLTGGRLDSNINEPGGIYLQDHGNPMQFRNIWLVEL
ncbi:MAG: DUF1080 domain-containing protein [Planctomycetota bacterium]|nr:DUF1080 domain-containing protein [Planctomycetota bacterium]